jgi:PAS domain S-box-containing protein
LSSNGIDSEYLDALHETAAGLMSRLDPEELLEDIVVRAARLVGTEHGYIYLVDPDGETMVVRVGVGFHRKHVGSRVGRGEGLAGTIWKTGEPLVVHSYGSWPGRIPEPAYESLNEVLGVPLRSGRKVIGVIALSTIEPTRKFVEGDVPRLTRFAHLASIAIDNARLYAAARQEVQERRRAESELRESELHYRTLFEAAQDAIFVVEGETCVDCNSAAQKLLRGRRDDIVEQSIFKFTPKRQRDGSSSRQRGSELVAKALKGKPQKFEWLFVDSQSRPFDADVSLSRFHIGGRTRLFIMVRDITERKELESQLLHSQKMEAIGRLSGGVAHDFNNLLTVIIGNAEVLRMKAGKDHLFSDKLDELISAGRNATVLVQQLLAFGRKQVLQPRVVDLGELVRDTHSLLVRLIGEDVELETVLEPGLGRVRVDPGQIQQVLMNISINARDAMPQGGRLVIETSGLEVDESLAGKLDVNMAPGRYVMLTVKDTGTGMDDETLSRIFEPFFTTKEAGKGTGLGLSTAYGIVKQSGGHIAVSSTPGLGTAFYIYIPLLETQEEPAREEVETGDERRGSEIVLLVEDDEGVRRLARVILGHYGYGVLEAATGMEALEVARESDDHIDLLLADVVMPGMSGLELARALSEVNPGMKVLYMSGYSEEAIARHGLLDPENNFIQKPFTPAGLTSKLREVIDATGKETGKEP